MEIIKQMICVAGILVVLIGLAALAFEKYIAQWWKGE